MCWCCWQLRWRRVDRERHGCGSGEDGRGLGRGEAWAATMAILVLPQVRLSEKESDWPCACLISAAASGMRWRPRRNRLCLRCRRGWRWQPCRRGCRRRGAGRPANGRRRGERTCRRPRHGSPRGGPRGWRPCRCQWLRRRGHRSGSSRRGCRRASVRGGRRRLPTARVSVRRMAKEGVRHGPRVPTGYP